MRNMFRVMCGCQMLLSLSFFQITIPYVSSLFLPRVLRSELSILSNEYYQRAFWLMFSYSIYPLLIAWTWCVGETEGHVNSVSLSLIECRSHTPYNVMLWVQLSACCIAMFSCLNRCQSHDVSNLLNDFWVVVMIICNVMLIWTPCILGCGQNPSAVLRTEGGPFPPVLVPYRGDLRHAVNVVSRCHVFLGLFLCARAYIRFWSFFCCQGWQRIWRVIEGIFELTQIMVKMPWRLTKEQIQRQ